MLTMTEYVHQRIQTYPRDLVGVDMTMGNGHDTLLLAQHCRNVYAFDVQKEALVRTQLKIGNQKHVQLILDSHHHIDCYLDSFDIGVFNLGYLPQLSHQTTTLLTTTQIAIEKAVGMMNVVLFVVVYPGHDEGLKESLWVDTYVSQLDRHQYHVSCYCMRNKERAPYVIEIEKL